MKSLKVKQLESTLQKQNDLFFEQLKLLVLDYNAYFLFGCGLTRSLFFDIIFQVIQALGIYMRIRRLCLNENDARC